MDGVVDAVISRAVRGKRHDVQVQTPNLEPQADGRYLANNPAPAFDVPPSHNICREPLGVGVYNVVTTRAGGGGKRRGIKEADGSGEE